MIFSSLYLCKPLSLYFMFTYNFTQLNFIDMNSNFCKISLQIFTFFDACRFEIYLLHCVLVFIENSFYRSNFEATPPPILIDNGLAVLENDKIERHIMKNIPGGHNLFVQDKDVAQRTENVYSVSKFCYVNLIFLSVHAF